MYIYIYIYIYVMVYINTINEKNTQSPSTPYCKYLGINISFLLIYLFMVHPSAKYNSEDNLTEDIKPLAAE